MVGQQNVSKEQQAIINAGGRVNSFYDTFEENRSEEELMNYKRSIGMPLAEDYDELIANLK